MDLPDDVCIYEVKAGDSLSGIAARFGYVTPTQLAKINRLPLFSGGVPPVFPGQKLIVPTASRGVTSPVKTRNAPGAALRVRSVSSGNSTEIGADPLSASGFAVNTNFYAHRAPGDHHSEPIDENSERQFVKVKAQRQLPSGDFVEGVLLITPDSLCFDALRTAMAQKQAYLETHRSSRSSSFETHEQSSTEPTAAVAVTITNPVDTAIDATSTIPVSSTNVDRNSPTVDPNPPPTGTPNIPKELLELGLCVPLDLLASMSTLRQLPESCPVDPLDDAISSSRAGTNGCTSPYLDDSENLTNPLDDAEVEASCEHLETIPATNDRENPESDVFTNRSHSMSSDPVTGRNHSPPDPSQEPQSINAVESSSVASPPDVDLPHTNPNYGRDVHGSNDLVECVADAPTPVKPHGLSESVRTTENRNTDHDDPPKTLYLRLTQFARNDEPKKEHIFLIAAEEIPEVFGFLLRNGVGQISVKHVSNGSHSPTGANHTATTAALRMTASMDSSHSFHRRTLVEEALESMECATPLPVLYGGTSTILNEEMLEDLGAYFPTHWVGCNLSLIYKTEQDGYSLNTLYRKSQHAHGGVLLIIRDTIGTVFGAILSERIHCSKHFYGTGETCVFHWAPTFKLTSSAIFSLRSGRNAIWFDEALKYGRSEPTDTFDNPVLSGTLPALRLASLSLTDCKPPEDERVDESRPRSQTDPSSPTVPGVNSVPFLIDCLEVWELVS
ncbi:hypothetical protein FGIG_02928 [Fasciola gigantica]|uniref:Oxidation resistance protein 1 n=1 Tax=Fasciola gigantica TaxID=46835 RepID=A0A504YAN3_FASGI|nr:hypothetical protein FGIG_02928 [Fasciola gigantica]